MVGALATHTGSIVNGLSDIGKKETILVRRIRYFVKIMKVRELTGLIRVIIFLPLREFDLIVYTLYGD